MGDFSRLNRLIIEAEENDRKAKEREQERLERYFEEKAIRELSRKDIKDISWNEIHTLENIKKCKELQKGKEYDMVHPNPERMEKLEQIFSIISEIESSPQAETVRKELEQVKLLLKKFVSMTPKNLPVPESEEEIADQEPVEVTKSGDTTHISGIASCDGIVDADGDMIHISAMKKAMPVFMKRNPAVNLGHTNRGIGRVTDYKFIKKDGRDALWIDVELFSQYKSDQTLINDVKRGVYKAFSIGGKAPYTVNECDNLKCWKGVPEIDLWEISLCEVGKNPLALLD